MTPELHPGTTEPLGTHVLSTLVNEYRKLKTLGDRALAQVPSDDAINLFLDPDSNSIVVIVRHLAGNFRSRWTDFLISDGEKPNRNRDGEFDQARRLTREETLAEWENGWSALLKAVEALKVEDLQRTVTIRGEVHTVFEAILRNQLHAAQHIGQILLLAKHTAGANWETLSIPRKR
jgi:Protein of unknown function (DUF1572)